MENENLYDMDCFAMTDKGCRALNYSGADLAPEICKNCRFKKGLADWLIESDRKKPSGIKGFNLIFDKENEGFFKNIKAIDNWLMDYWVEHRDKEYMPRNCLFDDFNVLFYTHEIEFKVI